MSGDVWFVLFGLVAVTLALGYYTRVELPIRENERMTQSLKAFSKAIELRFPSHAGMAARVSALSRFLGEELGLQPWDLQDMEMAAWLSDIGLASIPYRLLNRQDGYRWDESETAIYVRHPEVSAAMLEMVPVLRRLAPIVRSHHASFDGSSGPYFPHGQDLPIQARILKVISDFVWYERRQGQLLAREQLRHGSGTLYDPDIVRAFIGVLTSTRAIVQVEDRAAVAERV